MERRLLALNGCTKLLQLTYRNPVTVRQLNIRNDNAVFVRVNASRRALQRPEEIRYGAPISLMQHAGQRNCLYKLLLDARDVLQINLLFYSPHSEFGLPEVEALEQVEPEMTFRESPYDAVVPISSEESVPDHIKALQTLARQAVSTRELLQQAQAQSGYMFADYDSIDLGKFKACIVSAQTFYGAAL